jgi:hypothetical protein
VQIGLEIIEQRSQDHHALKLIANTTSFTVTLSAAVLMNRAG